MTEGVVCPFELLSALAPSHLLTSPLQGAGGPPLEGGLYVNRVSALMVGAVLALWPEPRAPNQPQCEDLQGDLCSLGLLTNL